MLLLVVGGTSAVLTSVRSGHRVAAARALRSGVDRTLASTTVGVRGDAQLADGTGRTTEFNVQARVDLAHSRLDAVLSAGTDQIRTINNGHTAWYSSDATAFTADLPPGVTWAAANATELAASGAVEPPADLLAVLYLTRGAISVHDDGPDIVNGVTTEGYSFPLDLNRAYCATEPAKRPVVQRAFHVHASAIITGQAWIDRTGRVVRALFTATGTGNSTGLGIRYELDLTAFNNPVPIRPPPYRQTTPSTRALIAAAFGTHPGPGTQPPADCP